MLIFFLMNALEIMSRHDRKMLLKFDILVSLPWSLNL